MSAVIKIAGVVKESIVDGPGIRYVVFAQGCKHQCRGCHNPGTHSFDEGSFVDTDSIIEQMKANPLLDGITLSGGDPFEQAEGFAELAQRARTSGYSVMTYTGYTYEEIIKNMSQKQGWAKLMENTDILVDGRFEETKKNLMLNFRGSDNQRIIDVTKSLAMDEIIHIKF
ncbi:MAG: anaerobic ribonucleoside-triphosphate reductase activating protein [Bacillota bacterium]|nr:anaerobic ribonucleoside-triphosphate reductase activating protein [Bacillota bacterium]